MPTRILLIEDDKKFAKNIKLALEIEGYQVDTAIDGPKGLAEGLLRKHDLIILDVALPLLNGLSVCSELRAQGVQVPIIMLTARGEMHDRVSGLDSGADDYLVKPFGLDELFARLRSLLRREKKEAQQLLTVADIVVVPARREITRAGTPLHLSPKEFALFLHLLRHKNTVIDRQELIRLLWKSSPEGNQFDVHVRYLRRKIDDGRAVKLLYTVKGVGYIIKEP